MFVEPQRLFQPDHAIAADLDRRVRMGLAESMQVLLTRAAETLRVSPGQAESLLGRLAEQRVGPGQFALYTDLVEALSNDDVGLARELLDAFEEERSLQATFRVTTLDDVDLGPNQALRYHRLISEGESVFLAPISSDAKAYATTRLAEAVALIERGAPDFAAELASLIGEFVVVTHRLQPGDACFASATTFYLWGSIVLDQVCLPDRLPLAATLIHEAAHAYLFGLTLGEKFVENPDDELHASPLRPDDRPMEGVFHATFVLGRLILFLETMLTSSALRADESEAARQTLRQLRTDFADGRRTIAAAARLKPLTRRLMDQMDRAVRCNEDD